MASTNQYVDPEVSRRKFEAELDAFMNIVDDYRRKGIFCLAATFPTIDLVFAIPQVAPSPIAFAVRIDFTNYDIEPPSVTFIDSFTARPLNRNEIPIHFPQLTVLPGYDSKKPPQLQPDKIRHLDLLQQDANGTTPFFCIPGIREYHNHPAHTGDSWLLYRGKGEGKLGFVIDQLYNHSIPTVQGYTINLVFNQQVKVSQ